MHVPFAGTALPRLFRRLPSAKLRHFLRHSAGIFSAPRRHLSGTVSGSFRRHFPGTAPAFFPPLRRYSASTFRRHFPGTPPASFPAPFRAPLRHLFRRSAGTRPTPPASSAGFISGLASRRRPAGISRRPAGTFSAPRRHPAEAPSRSGRTDLGSAAEGPRNQLQKRLSCSGSITSSTSPLARSISKSTPPPPVLGRPVVEISPPRGSAARRLPVWAPVEAPV